MFGIFAIKVESCQKSQQNLDVFWPSPILGGKPFKNCSHIITHALRHVVWKFRKDTPTSREVIGENMLNFGANFKFLQLNFFWGWGDPVPVGMCANKPWSIYRVTQKSSPIRFSTIILPGLSLFA